MKNRNKYIYLGIIVIVILVTITCIQRHTIKNKSQTNLPSEDKAVTLLKNIKSDLDLSGNVVARTGENSTTTLIAYSSTITRVIKTGNIYELTYDNDDVYEAVTKYLEDKLGEKLVTGADAAEVFSNSNVVCWHQLHQSGQGDLYIWCAEIVSNEIDLSQ